MRIMKTDNTETQDIRLGTQNLYHTCVNLLSVSLDISQKGHNVTKQKQTICRTTSYMPLSLNTYMHAYIHVTQVHTLRMYIPTFVGHLYSFLPSLKSSYGSSLVCLICVSLVQSSYFRKPRGDAPACRCGGGRHVLMCMYV